MTPGRTPYPPRSTTARAAAAAALLLLLAASGPRASSFRTGGRVGRRSAPTSAAARAPPPSLLRRTRALRSARQEEDVATSSSSATPGEAWRPEVSSLGDRRSYFRERSSEGGGEALGTLGFHHVEFYAGDALTTAKRFELALGMPVTCHSGLATGNDVCVSYGLECGVVEGDGGPVPGEGVRFLITAPLSRAMQRGEESSSSDAGANANGGPGSDVQMSAPYPLPGYDNDAAHEFVCKHGMAVRAVGVEVKDVAAAYEAAIANGAIEVLEPTAVSSASGGRGCDVAELKLYGDVVLRLVGFHNAPASANGVNESDEDSPTPFLPHLAPHPAARKGKPTYGLSRVDHAVGNVPDLLSAQRYVQSFTGYHPFAEFTPEDVGTVDSGLNSVVLASDDESVLLPLNEPTEGRRKSQIQTYLEQNEGPGLQHLALKTDDIFATIAKMREAEERFGGFELMARPSEGYYRELPSRLGDRLTEEQYARLEELGVLADADDEGVLLQIFTRPLGDRPTVFLEIIQRIGCLLEGDEKVGAAAGEGERRRKERPGCGGFGQGNFRELFKAIEDHEKTLKV